jgi:alkanesulfonate monooxygenase SsuD/methylene tetrahydromethanopterin reductase-like flavin-dependent oxidoreductase (luciferase family)
MPWPNRAVGEHIPVVIGGSGEKKTFPLTARHFDHLNVFAVFDDLASKVTVLRRCCEEVSSDPATLQTRALVTTILAPMSRRNTFRRQGRR